MTKWNSMSSHQQTLLIKEIAALSNRMWAETAIEDEIAISCITGGKCTIGESGAMKLVKPSNDDLAVRDKIVNDVILARWAKRCGAECAETWNKTIGSILGLKAGAK